MASAAVFDCLAYIIRGSLGFSKWEFAFLLTQFVALRLSLIIIPLHVIN
jgi:hypothetical protein